MVKLNQRVCPTLTRTEEPEDPSRLVLRGNGAQGEGRSDDPWGGVRARTRGGGAEVGMCGAVVGDSGGDGGAEACLWRLWCLHGSQLFAGGSVGKPQPAVMEPEG